MEISISQRKEFIILTAVDLIHENGIHNVSTKEIARRLGISESLVFKEFPRKKDILLAVLERFTLFDKPLYQSAVNYEDELQSIRFLMKAYLSYYENYPAITAVFQVYDSFQENPEIEKEAKLIFFRRLGYLTSLVKRAQASGKLDASLDAETIADMLVSILRGMCLKWRMSDYSFSLRERAGSAIEFLLSNLIIEKT